MFIALTAAEKTVAPKKSSNVTAEVTKTKDVRGKRNLNGFGNYQTAGRRIGNGDGYDYSQQQFQGASGGYSKYFHVLNHLNVSNILKFTDYEPNFVNSGSDAGQNYPQYAEAPEPIIEIIIQDNNETLPAPEQYIQTGSGKRKKEQVQVFYVKYHKDEKSGLVIHDPIPALSPASHNQEEEDSYEEPLQIVTPLPQLPQKTTTLRTIIRPDSEQYESSSGVHVTFGSHGSHQHNQYKKSDNHIHDEHKEESAVQPVVSLPQNRIDPGNQIKEKREQSSFPQSQGRVVNGGTNFQQQQQRPPTPPQQQHQNEQYQHQHQQQHQNEQYQHQQHQNQQNLNSFNPQNNFVAPPNSGFLSSQLVLPHQGPSKPFHPNSPPQQLQQQHPGAPRPSPIPIPIHHQQTQQQGLLAQQSQQQFSHQQQFSQPPQRPQQPLNLRPPQRQPATANFNQQQRPFNYHAQQAVQQPIQQQIRFPPQQTQFQGQNLPPSFQQLPIPSNQPLLQRPGLPPRAGPPPPSFHNQNQLPPINRPGPPFNSQFNQQQQTQFAQGSQSQFQQGPPNQGPPLNFRPKPVESSPTHQHNQIQHTQHIQSQQQHSQFNENNVFRGGLVEGPSPNLSQARPAQPPQFQSPQNAGQQQQSQQHFQSHNEQSQFTQNFVRDNFEGGELISSIPKFEHHITETVNNPVFFQQTDIHMDQVQQQKQPQLSPGPQNIGPLSGSIGLLSNSQKQQEFQQKDVAEHQHRFSVQQQQSQYQEGVTNHFDGEHKQKQFPSQPQQPQKTHHQTQHQNHPQLGVSNHYSDAFPAIENKQKQFSSQSFLEQNGRNNFGSSNDESHVRGQGVQATYRPTSSAPATSKRVEPTTTTTPRPTPSTTKRPPSNFVLPDEVPDDLREQLLSSGILDNADISVLDYDKIGETSLQDLPAEHLSNFFSAGGGAQIGASNKVLSVVKPNGDSINEKVKALQSDREVTKYLENVKKLPSKKEDVNLKVVRFDAQSQLNIPQQYIQQDSKILSPVNLNQNIYNRYLPLKINGAQFPIPDVEELRGRKISSVVVLAPVDNLVNGQEAATSDEGRYERDTLETKQIKFVAGDTLKQLLKKPTSDNYKRWLEKEQKTNADLQSVVLLVTK